MIWAETCSNEWCNSCRPQWPSDLRRGSAAHRLLRLRVRIPQGVWMFVLWVVCVVRQRSLRRADPSFRGILPSVVCHYMWSRNLKNEAALARVGLLRQRGKSVIVGRCVWRRNVYVFITYRLFSVIILYYACNTISVQATSIIITNTGIFWAVCNFR